MIDQTCLVTGGAGFIGCALSGALASRYARVVAVDNLHAQVHVRQQRPPALDRRVELQVADVCSAETWNALLPSIRPDVVIHLAAETGTGQSLVEASRHARVNVVGTTEFLDGLVRHHCIPRHIVLASSRAVYGEGGWRDPEDGSTIYPGQRSKGQLEARQWSFGTCEPLPFEAGVTRTLPVSVYGATKLAQENVLLAWASALDVDASVLRLQNVYGPGQSLGNPYTGICTLFAQKARGGEAIPVFEDGRIIRDFVYITDVASALLAALAIPPRGVRTCDVGSGQATSILALARHFATYYGAPAPEITGAYRPGDVRHAACSIAMARAALNWDPVIELKAGIARLCEWTDRTLESTTATSSAA